ncbi:hypothetical protein EV127DRAFT_470863, partial [Xylaria flabelliformis]
MSGLNCWASTPERDVWTEKAAVIRQLYLSERKTLKQVKEILEREHEFPIFPLSTYETTLRDRLQLRKKLKRADWSIVYHHFRNRGGKETGLYLNGARIPWNKAWKEIRRSGARSISNVGQPVPLPGGVTVRTPSPVMRPVSPAFPKIQDSLHSGSFPPAQTLLVAQDETPNIDFQSLPHASVILPTRGNLHDLSLVQYTSQTANEASAVAGTRNFDMSFYRSFLQTTPWNQFNKKIRSLFGDIAQPPNLRGPTNSRLFDSDISGNFTYFLPGSLAYRMKLPDTTPLSRSRGNSGVPALNFSSYHFLTKLLHLLSNKMNILPGSSNMYGHISDFFDILFDRLHSGLLLKLFESGLPTMRAAWEASVPLAFRVHHQRAFSRLMEIGIQNPDWILVDRHRYLSSAILMGCISIVRCL